MNWLTLSELSNSGLAGLLIELTYCSRALLLLSCKATAMCSGMEGSAAPSGVAFTKRFPTPCVPVGTQVCADPAEAVISSDAAISKEAVRTVPQLRNSEDIRFPFCRYVLPYFAP